MDVSTAAGIAWQFKPEGGDWKDIAVPAGGWRAQGYTCDAGTYRTTIPVPKNAAAQIVRLVFAAVNFGADVSAGPDDDHLAPVASHVDGWVPVTADITKVAVPGAPLRVQVAVKGRRKFMLNGKYIVPEGATWDPFLEEGILRGVRLEILPAVHVEDLFVRTDVDGKTLQPTVTVTNAGGAPQTINVVSQLSSWNKSSFLYPEIPDATVTLGAGETRAVDLGKIAWNLGPESYWWPNLPYRPGYEAQLHVLQVEIKADGKVLHRFSQRFGFRQFEASGAHYNLNGIHFNLRGDNQQEADFGTDGYGIRPGFGPPTAGNAGWPQAVDNLLHLNFTIMRIHQIPATTYMLDVCDEKGLMLIEESPLRGSEGGENYKGGKDNMLNMDRELVLRDRNHPATAIWSAANEWSDPIKDAVKVIQSVDDTRPIIADGCGDMGAPYINIEHYCSGFNGVPDRGGHPRTDRPYGEGEAVWPRDNSRQGFAWMATGTRLRRLKGNADIRNYVLNNAWSNYVPGEDENNEVLEVKVKGSRDAKILPALADPWHDPNILLMQKCYNPLAVCDLDFDERNKRSNKNGDWPVSRPLIPSGARVTRTLALFNDELAGEDVQVSWELHSASKTGPIVKRGQFTLQIPLGEFRKWDIVFDTPPAPADLFLTVISSKNGQERFKDDLIAYKVGDAAGPLLKDGDYALINGSSGMAAEPGTYENKLAVVQQPVSTEPRQVWHLTHTSADEVTLTNKATGQVLGIDGESKENGALAVPEAGTGAPSQVWHVEALDETTFTFSNKATGKLLDVYGSSTTPGGRIVQWDTNGGANQTWQIAKK